MYKYIIKQTTINNKIDKDDTDVTADTADTADTNVTIVEKTDTSAINVSKLPIIKPSIINTNVNGFATIMSINLVYVNKLNKCKDKISKFKGNEWEELKKLSNPYEYIYIFNYKNQYTGIAKVKPLSRSFFKMIEMGNDFLGSLKKKKHFKSLHLAEGPGGFIEAVRYIRGDLGINDQHFGITLIDKRKSVPCWSQSAQFLVNNPQVKILYGADGTGNLYNTDNILNVIKCVTCVTCVTGTSGAAANTDASIGDESMDNKCDLITGDGGFDFSVDYNYQEQASSKLIFAQIICALKCLRVSDNSVFICKIFDMSNYLTVELIYLISLFFKSVVLYKPVTSRVANSEKYIVCTGFLGCSDEYWQQLLEVLNYWNKIEKEYDDKKKAKTINFIFETIETDFVLLIKKINMEIIDIQIESITKTVEIAKKGVLHSCNYSNDSSDYRNYSSYSSACNNEWYGKNKKMQIEKAKEWCAKNGIPH